MKNNKHIIFVLSVILTVLFGYFCLSLNAATTVVPTSQKQTANLIGDKQQVVLYEQQVGDLTDEQMNKIWPSNNSRTWILTGIMDGEKKVHYKAWENKYNSQVAGTKDAKGLEDNTDLTVSIKNLNIKASDYMDIRLTLDYIDNGGSTSLTNACSLEVYAVDSGHKKYGPFLLQYAQPQRFYMRMEGKTQRFDRGVILTTEHIKVPHNVVISEFEIKPYANYPSSIFAAAKAGGKNWRGRGALTFALAGMKVTGYRTTGYRLPSYVKTRKIDVEKVREKIVQRMYDQATVKWSPTVTFHDMHVRLTGITPRSIYTPGNIYYGLPYTQRNRTTVEKFSSEIKDGILAEPESITEVWGMDCVASVDYAISNYVPLPLMCLTPDFIWDRNNFSLLGNLTVDGKQVSSASLKKSYLPQEIYEAYAKLQKGDVVGTHSEKGAHVRLVSGNTHVVRNSDGVIDPINSYFIIVETSSNLADTKVKNNVGGLLTSEDYVVPFKPNKKYTDIENLSELEGKNTNFRVNKKVTFTQAYNGCYAPLTLNAYLTGTVEEPYARAINSNTADDIHNGFKGTIYSNYTILSIKYLIKNKDNGEEKTFTEYPNHSSVTLEGRYNTIYSLYYNTPIVIQNYVKETIRKAKSFEVSVSVAVGENESIEVLRINK